MDVSLVQFRIVWIASSLQHAQNVISVWFGFQDHVNVQLEQDWLSMGRFVAWQWLRKKVVPMEKWVITSITVSVQWVNIWSRGHVLDLFFIDEYNI